MRLLSSRALLLVLCGVLACGCSLTAKKVPTPAAQLTGDDLARLPREPDDRYFIIFFGANDLPHRPEHCHTWATLVRVKANDVGRCGVRMPGCVDPTLDVWTISWLPVTGDINVRSRVVEPGRNYELHETMKFACDANAPVAYWGPYEVWHGFAHRFRIQKEFLDTGVVGYQANDVVGEAARLGNGCDCIHAVTDMDPVYPRWRYPLVWFGKPATTNLVRRFMHSPIWIGAPETHEWLLPRLGLDAYQLQKRQYTGRVEPYKPGQRQDLDSTAPPILPVEPKPKDPTPKTAPGIENGKKPIEIPKPPE